MENRNVRNSNIELLRIFAMFMVLMLHVNYMSIGEPTTAEANNLIFPTFLRVFFQQTANIAVDLFVLISGWFGIKFGTKRCLKFVFQCVFIISLMYIIGLCIGDAKLELNQIMECLLLGSNEWFIKCYLALMIISPILNTYVENTDEPTQRKVLVLFYIFQTIFGALTMSASFIKAGFSVFSFVGLYLLARYMRVYGEKYMKYAKSIYIFSMIISVMWFYLPLRLGIMRIAYMSLLYTFPFCITGALGLLMWMASKKTVQISYINFIASSCFTVYLFHICNTWTSTWYMKISKIIYDSYSGIIYLVYILLFIFTIYTLATLLDQIRKFSWRIIEKNSHVAKNKRPYNTAIE